MDIPQPTMDILPTEVDWEQAKRLTYKIHQRFRYEYPAPIRDLRQKLMILPPLEFGDQTRIAYEFDVSQPHEIAVRLDPFLNTVLDVRVPRVEAAIDFELSVTVQRSQPLAPRLLAAGWLSDERLLRPTERTAPDARLRAAAADLARGKASALDLALQANSWVHHAISYSFGVTTIHTTAAEALEGGVGVCQDYAHVLLTILRLLGLPCLYVSGHMLGEGGTHAWVEVLLPAADGSGRAEAWPLDPTHDSRAGLKYVSIAAGRDYGDVAPTSGSYRAAFSGNLLSRKQVKLTDVAYAL
ncbi:MAG: transglutaminase domain-containing protein [Dehalococcoidia bacterium]